VGVFNRHSHFQLWLEMGIDLDSKNFSGPLRCAYDLIALAGGGDTPLVIIHT